MANRILKESVKTSPEIDQLSWFEEVVFYRLVVSADDYGCFDGRMIVIKNELFPTKECVTRKNVEDAIEKLESVKLLKRYEVEGRPYILLTTWNEHQRIRDSKRKYPAPDNSPQVAASCRKFPPKSESESESESNKEITKEKRDRFSRPSIDEVRAYCVERHNNVDPEKWYDYYSANGWKVGKNAMKDWKAAVRTWERNSYSSTVEVEAPRKYEMNVNDL